MSLALSHRRRAPSVTALIAVIWRRHGRVRPVRLDAGSDLFEIHSPDRAARRTNARRHATDYARAGDQPHRAVSGAGADTSLGLTQKSVRQSPEKNIQPASVLPIKAGHGGRHRRGSYLARALG